MGPARPAVDVAVPCYNYGRYLSACVQSLLDQPEVDVRVLIIDDASNDDSAEVAQELAARHPNVEYRRHRSNQGHISTFNEGVEWATAEFFVLISADDLLTPRSLHRSTSALRQHPTAGLVYGPAIIFDGDPPPVEVADSYRVSLFRGHQWLARRMADGLNPITSAEVVVRTALQQQVGYYDARCAHTSDLNMWLRFAAMADVARVQRVPQAYYRRHGANMSLVQFSDALADLEQRRRAFEAFFVQAALEPELRQRWERAVRRTLATEALTRASRQLDRLGPNDESAALAGFAEAVTVQWSTLPAGRGYRLRHRLGPGRLTWLPPFLVGRAYRWCKTRIERAHLYWRGD